MKFASVLTVAACLLCVCAAGRAQAAPVATASAAAAVISGTITDARNLPVAGAVITARGSAVGWTATQHDGTYILTLPPGSYEILVRKGGYTPNSSTIVVGPGASTISLTLAEANLTSVTPGMTRSDASVPFNSGVAARATLSAAAISERPEPALRDLALELPGVALAHPNESSPDSSFIVRGGTVETRVQIDGHAVSAGATGRWNSSYASAPLFDSIEVVKGIALSGANAGESAFGTINLRTRDFSRGRAEDVVIGFDGFGGSYQTFAFSGNAFDRDRLSYVIEHNVSQYDGPNQKRYAYNAVAEPGGTALITGRVPLDDPLILAGDLLKLRWRFSSATSLTAGYVGVHSAYAQSGGAYATFLGNRTIVAAAPDSFGGTIEGSPNFAGLIGKTVPVYTLPYNTTVKSNQPLFEAEFRTAINNDTLLIRPYVGTIYHVVSGQSANTGDPSGGGSWTTDTTSAGCSVAAPCFRAGSGSSPFRDQESDRLHGTTATLVHPMGDATLNFSYDYRSDQTMVAIGNPTIVPGATPQSQLGYQASTPPAVARNFDWSTTYTLPLTSRLRLYAGDYYTNWKLNFASIAIVPNFATGAVDHVLTFGERVYRHNDPHLGFTWEPQSATSYRLSAGSAVTLPYADLMTGEERATGLFTDGQIGFKNPDLKPEVTFAYNLGVDHRLRNGAVVSADVFDATIHNVFAARVTPFDGRAFNIPPGSPYNSIFATASTPVNAPLERNYGVELSIARAPALGFGYRATGTFQRAFVDELSVGTIGSGSTLVNGRQLSGSTAIPYAQAYAQLSYRHRSGLSGSLGVDYTGSDNWTNGPAFTQWSSMLRYDLKGGYRAQFSIENLLDHRTASQYASGTAAGVPPGTIPGAYGSAIGGGPATFDTTSGTIFGIAPRTFRFQLEAHLGH